MQVEVRNRECYKCRKLNECNYVNIPHSECYRREIE